MSAISSSTATSTRRPKRARRRRSDSRPSRLGIDDIIGYAGAPQLGECSGADAAHAGFGQADPSPDFLERQTMLVVQHQHAPLERREEPERATPGTPPRIPRPGPGGGGV